MYLYRPVRTNSAFCFGVGNADKLLFNAITDESIINTPSTEMSKPIILNPYGIVTSISLIRAK